ncbi:MAG: hypothetical protein JSW46_10150 [Gemmatimonadota bacterium]|nr:MAG: hypothetical protein JSW46_10150 [Gemmatimonadota bacterium]
MKRALFLACVLTVAVSPVDLCAQVRLGVHGSWAEDADWGLGGRVAVQLPVDRVPLVLVGSFDWFWPEADEIEDYWEINANLVMRPTLELIAGYFGIGLNLAHTVAEDPFRAGTFSETKAGINLVGGLIYDGILTPYGEVRYEVGGGEQFVVTVGIGINLATFTGIR